MRFVVIGFVVFIIGHWVGKVRGKAELSTFVWNLLAGNRSEAMVEAVLLYCAAKSYSVRLKNGWKTTHEIAQALKSKAPLRDDC